MNICILCVDDEPEVLAAIERDLRPFDDTFPVESAESAAEARDLIHRIQERGDRVGLLICDHLMPGETGVELLVDLQKAPATRPIRKMLLTGQAGLDETVQALNAGGLHFYIAKPWNPDTLRTAVREQLTRYFLAEHLDPLPCMQHLDPLLVTEALRGNPTQHGN